jgi:hypothetical protein
VCAFVLVLISSFFSRFLEKQGFLELGKGDAFDTFPNMFPDEQYLRDSEIKHGRQAMLAWTGVWATSTVRYDSVAVAHMREYEDTDRIVIVLSVIQIT